MDNTEKFIERFVKAYDSLLEDERKTQFHSVGLFKLIDVVKEMKSTKPYCEKMLNKICILEWDKKGYNLSLGFSRGADYDLMKIKGDHYKFVHIGKVKNRATK